MRSLQDYKTFIKQTTNWPVPKFHACMFQQVRVLDMFYCILVEWTTYDINKHDVLTWHVYTIHEHHKQHQPAERKKSTYGSDTYRWNTTAHSCDTALIVVAAVAMWCAWFSHLQCHRIPCPRAAGLCRSLHAQQWLPLSKGFVCLFFVYTTLDTKL